MMSQFNICFGPYHDLLASLTVHLEQWVFQALFAVSLGPETSRSPRKLGKNFLLLRYPLHHHRSRK
ncbi:rCG25611, isoform CRA_b [Rattus norvegicus]|uniref:RCG25611, isoform CRA_b n=1 Tax=Rattus norvegicus TaxID=10116 RepID=A6I1I9_RAT|nr:rCG25611, isoform CRA_b [Rattus norvegicus]